MKQIQSLEVYELPNFELLITKAVPCGIILNELIMNAQKHAFPQNKKGNIAVGLKEKADQMIELYVHDDGIALPRDYSSTEADGLGLTLIRILSTQIDGEFTIDTSRGKKFTILLSLD